jgi:hypothetical protein
MEPVAGLIATALTVFAVTVKVMVPLMPVKSAVMEAVPELTPVARPALLMATTGVLLEDQVAVEVMLAVVPLLYVAVAVNCWLEPAVRLEMLGVMAIEVGVAAVTVSAAVPLSPLMEAVMVVVPAATPVARPEALIVTVAVLDEDQVAVLVTVAVEPSL